MNMRTGKGLGWRRQLPDQRDRVYAAPAPIATALPEQVDLRHSGFSFPAWDQGQTNSCVGHGVAAIMQYVMLKQGLIRPDENVSRMFLYYNGRMIEGTQDTDAGCNIRDAIKGAATYGVCLESDWPFDPARINDKPPDTAYQAAQKYKAIDYQAVPQDVNHMRACLAEGYPFTFGMMVYPEFTGPDMQTSGRLAMPSVSERPEGGHCTSIFGFDDDANSQRVFLDRNSWGETWGPFKGYFLSLYEFLADPNLCSDFWVIRAIGPSP